MSSFTRVLDLTFGIIKRVSRQIDEQTPFEQAVHEVDNIEMFAIRFKTGFKTNYTYYNEIRFVNIPKLKSKELPELCLRILSWQPFKYHPGHESCFATTIFIFPEKTEGFFKPASFRDVTLGNVLIVVLDPRVGEDKQKASYFAYLTSYFAQRAENILSKLLNKRPLKLRIWDRVRGVFSGRLESLSSTLSKLYN